MRKYKKFAVIEGVGDSVNPRGKKYFGNLLTVLERESGGLDGEHVSFRMGPEQITQLSLLFISLLLNFSSFFFPLLLCCLKLKFIEIG